MTVDKRAENWPARATDQKILKGSASATAEEPPRQLNVWVSSAELGMKFALLL